MRARHLGFLLGMTCAAALVAVGCGSDESADSAESTDAAVEAPFGEAMLVAAGGKDPDLAFGDDGTVYLSWAQPVDSDPMPDEDASSEAAGGETEHEMHDDAEHDGGDEESGATDDEGAAATDDADDHDHAHESSHGGGDKLDVMLATSDDGGETFGDPVRVNDMPGEVYSAANTHPKVLVADDERIIVSWTTAKPYEGQEYGQNTVRIAESTDGGETFAKARDLLSTKVEGAVTSESYQDLEVLEDGSVAAAFLDYRGSFAVPSVDTIGVRTAVWKKGEPWFGRSVLVDEQTCECCDNALAADEDRLLLAFRDQVPNDDGKPIRDSAMRVSTDDGATWSEDPVRLGEDDWEFDQCPESGPDLGVDGEGDIHGVYYTGVEGRPGVYHAYSTNDGETFEAHELDTDEEFYPSSGMDLAALDEGALVAWDDHREEQSVVGVALVDAAGMHEITTELFEGSTPSVASLDGHMLLAYAAEDGIRIASSGSHDHAGHGGDDSKADDEPAADDEPTEDDVDASFTAAIVDGTVEGGPQSWSVDEGDMVRITATSDVAEELHLHGYDISRDITPGGSATIEFEADTVGSFEVELEESKQLVGILEVQ